MAIPARFSVAVSTGYAQTTTPAYVLRGTRVLWVIAAHLGSPRRLVDSVTGETVGRRDHDEWGRVTQDTLGAWLTQGFAVGLYDSDTALVRFGARDYDAETGRWLSRDPMLFEGGQGNLYEYVSSGPINHSDARGLATGSEARNSKTDVVRIPWTYWAVIAARDRSGR